MPSNRIVALVASAVVLASCMANGAPSAAPIRLHVSCDVPATALRLRDVPLGMVVRPAGARFVIAHDVGGVFAFSTVPRGGACEVSCGDDDTFVDPCHFGR